MATLSGRFHFRFKIFGFDFLHHAFGSDFFRVIGDVQQVLIPNILDQGHTGKPYQGLFHPIGSIRSQEVQPFAHPFDMESDFRTGGRVAGRLAAAGDNERQQSERRHEPDFIGHSTEHYGFPAGIAQTTRKPIS